MKLLCVVFILTTQPVRLKMDALPDIHRPSSGSDSEIILLLPFLERMEMLDDMDILESDTFSEILEQHHEK